MAGRCGRVGYVRCLASLFSTYADWESIIHNLVEKIRSFPSSSSCPPVHSFPQSSAKVRCVVISPILISFKFSTMLSFPVADPVFNPERRSEQITYLTMIFLPPFSILS